MITKLTGTVAKRMKKSRVIVTDVNRTISKNKLCNPFNGFLPIVREDIRECDLKISRVYLTVFALGALNKLNVRDSLKNFVLKTYHKSLNGVDGRVDEGVEKIMKAHLSPGVKEFFDVAKDFGEPKKVVVLTRNFDFVAKAAAKILGATDYVSNDIEYDENGVAKLLMRNAEDRKRLIKEKLKQRYDIGIEDSTFLGDKYEDDFVPFKGSRVFIASPYAEKIVKESADFAPLSYLHARNQILAY